MYENPENREIYKFSVESDVMTYVKEGDYSEGAVITVGEEGADGLLDAVRDIFGEDSVEQVVPDVMVIDAALSGDEVDDLASRNEVRAVSPSYGAKIPEIEPVEEMDRYLSI